MEHAPLPIIDLGALLGSPQARTEQLALLRRTAREVGFFYLTGHGLEAAALAAPLALGERLFALPAEQKRAVAMLHSPHFRGYTGFGAELTRGRPDQREQFDIMNEGQALAEVRLPWQRLIGPNQWPERLPELRPLLLGWQSRMGQIGSQLLAAFAEALGQSPDMFHDNLSPEPYLHTKLIHYPGVSGGERQGVGAHKDPGYLTLLLQDSRGGLEVEMNGQWVAVPPLPGALIVNIGELLELASDGYLRATLHRVVSPAAGIDRLSCAVFMAARLDTEVPLMALPAELAALAEGPQSDPANPLFTQVGDNVLKGRLRSHPDVAARHYPQPAVA
ncbi:isopenicillin N synthase family dioxygenase [Aeromonas simiae]|uniref:isopenicillin N synthase family dioxygenase n=1 Tax=Aeromonas simiae TaxID=218936 RepID=UPI0005AAC3CE|nr:2-oxoglutarate and iron-dependent oxygenase domain-containing protein [Aeromonas simiae]